MAEAKRVTSFSLTLDTTIQQLAIPNVDIAVPLREVAIQPGHGNTGLVYVGGPLVAAGNGIELPIPVSSVPSAPFVLGEFDDGSINLGDFYVVGTVNGDTVHVLVLAYV
jgi:hypothetical protein